jgi:hypothetical protein
VRSIEEPFLVVRRNAEHYILLLIVSFVVAVVGTRWYLQATGYPQVGGGELHIAHMLWGGLLLVIAALLLLLVDRAWVLTVAAVMVGAGTGLFIDEVGKFITVSNDYFYPLAAPLIYGLLLALVLVFVLVRRRGHSGDAVGPRVSAWEANHLPQRRYRRLLVAGLALVGTGWLLSLALYLAVDPSVIHEAIESYVNVPGDPVERPDDPSFYWLEAMILGLSAVAVLTGAIALGTGREAAGELLAIVGLVIALTAGAIVSLYVEQVSAIASTLVNAILLLAVVRYRGRFPGPSDGRESTA